MQQTERGKTMPIIQSLLDVDYYKLTMLQLVWKHFQDIQVKYAFKNRTSRVALADFVQEEDLRRELESIQKLRFTPDEIFYLRAGSFTKGLFSEDFLKFLANLQLSEFVLKKNGPTYRIEATGRWPDAILWETLILSTVNELYYRSLLERGGYSLLDVETEGMRRFLKKVETLRKFPEITFTDFGTRRRFSKARQEQVVSSMQDLLPQQFLGTSNVLLAKQLGLRPIGTFAHEMYMVFSGIFHDSDDAIRDSHNKVIQMWWEMYGEPLSIALTDTYDSDFFFRDFTREQAQCWRGLRQDSGNPIDFGEKTIAFYERYGIDPRTKLIVFSDGLDVETIVKLHRHFKGRIQTTFGWGTNLTNDLGFGALSLVVKAVEANGYGTVKLSDNLAKAMGKPEDVERFKRIFGHTVTTFEKCRY